MKPPIKKITVVTLDRGSDNETEIEIRDLIDLSNLPPAAASPACGQLARWFADQVMDGASFRLSNTPDALITEFRRACKRRGVAVTAGMARNQFGELVGLGHIELKQKVAP